MRNLLNKSQPRK